MVFPVALAALISVWGCGKKDDAASTAPSATASAATPTDTAAAATVAPTPVPQPVPVPTTPKVGGNIDGCCSGIAAVKSSGKDQASKNKAAAAALACPGISKAVKDGKTSRGDALVQIKSLLGGVTVPECN